MVIFANHGDYGDEDDGNGNVRPCLLPVTDWLFLEQLRQNSVPKKSLPQSEDDDKTYDDPVPLLTTWV